MQKMYRFILSLFLVLTAHALVAQSCEYELQMFDTFGDGWNGGQLTIRTGSDSATFSLTPDIGDGSFFQLCFPVTDGDTMVLGYEAGAFPGEVSFIISDNGGQTVFESGLAPTVGDSIFQTVVTCASCVAPSFCGDINFSRLRSFSVDFFWNSSPPDQSGQAPVYLIEYDTTGFTPGAGQFLTSSDTIFRIQPLSENTTYDVYISTLCEMRTDTSVARGPFTFTTPRSTDVGVTLLAEPVSGCDLGSRQISLGLTNFGGMPQSFIPFDFSVDGLASGVAMPQDGLYTGVLGVDSTEFTTFDMAFDFSEFRSYEVKVWTALPDDQDLSNDTLTVLVNSVPVINQLPYYETFEDDNGGWTASQAGTGAVSWEHGQPTGNLISSAGSGQNAWVTNLDGPYNNNENSFLFSPCFDFSDIEEDPIISLLLFVNTENGFDEVFLEASSDDINWTKVGAANNGLNWYNDPENNWWEGDGGFGNNWVLASQVLSGMAGEGKVRLRFVFSSDGSVVGEGVGIDNVYIGPQQEFDLAAASLASSSEIICGTPNDTLNFSFFNLGSSTATDITLNYSVNGGEPISESYPESLASFSQASYQFQTLYDGTQSSPIVITAWVELEGDGFLVNDSTTITVINRKALPLLEDFENGRPTDWLIDPDIVVGTAHNSGSNVLFDNLWSFDQEMRASTPNLGLIELGDTLFFDYRFVDFDGNGETGTTLSAGDSLQISLIVNCDTLQIPFFTINSSNHTTTNEFTRLALSLEDYVGSSIQIVFEAAWGAGDYFLDIDNINIRRCLPSFNASAEVSNASSATAADGAIRVMPFLGFAPFSYLWNDSITSPELIGVPPGNYSLLLTDAQGCTETLNFTVSFMTSNREPEAKPLDVTLAPNPTSGLVNVQMQLQESRPIRLFVINQLGQILQEQNLGVQSNVQEQIDLSQQAAGIYFLRVFAGKEQKTLRLLKTTP